MSGKMRWYVVQAFSGFEQRVATSLREHIKIQNMEDKFGEVLVPTEEVVKCALARNVSLNASFSLAMC